jgi:serine/threonine-protein kinase
MALTLAADLLDAIIQHGLVDKDQADELRALRLDCADALMAELCRRDLLTPHQLEALRSGTPERLLLGSYLLLEPIGAGGMGQVFRARHRLMRREVAVKLIRPEFAADPAALARFRQEVQAVARLNHPNIVVAHDAQQSGGQTFLVMEYCAGRNLRDIVRDYGPLPVGLCCDLLRQTALGLQHAFERGLIHRDIKPDNLLLLRGEDDADGPGGAARVKILDFGLARLKATPASAETPFTRAGVLCGTPDFVAPEQALEPTSADTRADLYSLGCTAYFLLTGQAPFPGGDAAQKLLQHRVAAPAPITALRPDLPASVVALVQQLLQKEPAARPQTAGELAEALGRLRLPVESLPKTPVLAEDRAGTNDVDGGAATPPAPSRPSQSWLRASLARLRAPVPPGERAPRRRAAARIAAASVAALGVGAVALAMWLGRSEPNGAATPPLGQAAPGGAPSPRWVLMHTLHAHAPARALAFSNDSKLLAAGCGRSINQDAAGVLIWEAATGARHARLPDPRAVDALVFSRDDKTLASSHGDPTEPPDQREIILWDTAPWRRRDSLAASSWRVTGLSFRRDGTSLAVAGDRQLAFWHVSLAHERRLHGAQPAGGTIAAIAYSPDGVVLATAGHRQPVRLFAVFDSDLRGALPGGLLHAADGARLAFAPDGKTLAVVTSDGASHAEARIWRLAAEGQTHRLLRSERHPRGFTACALSADGAALLTADNRQLLAWDTHGNAAPAVIAEAPGGFHDVVVSPDGSVLAAAADAGHVTVWRNVLALAKLSKTH